MSSIVRFILRMKHELSPPQKKTRKFAWVLDEKKYIKLLEVEKLRGACKKARDIAVRREKQPPIRNWFMVELGLNTGLRVEEMNELQCGDFYINEEEASVYVKRGKGGKPRTVFINEKFKAICQWFLAWKKKQEQPVDPDSYVFTDDTGKKLSKRTLQKAFTRCIALAGLPSHYSIHCLRHTYATHLLKASGYNIRLVQEQLGHSSVRTTEVYTSLIANDVKEALSKLYVSKKG